MNVRVVLLSVGVVGLLGSIAAAADDGCCRRALATSAAP